MLTTFIDSISVYCKFGNFREGFIYAKLRENKSSRNGKITLSFTDLGKSCPSHEILTTKICLLTLFAKMRFSLKFPDLQ